MKLQVITPDEMLFDGTVSKVNVTSKEGGFTILKGHAPLIVTLERPLIKAFGEGDQVTYIRVSGGTLKVLKDDVAFLIGYGASGLTEAEAVANYEALKEQMGKNNQSQADDAVTRMEMEILRRASELGG